MFEKLISLLPSLEENDGKFGEWIIDRKNDGSPEHPIQMPYVSYGRTSMELEQEIYRIVDEFPELHLTKYADILKEHGVEWDGRQMEEADVSDWDAQGVLALMVGIIRADRFSEGTYKEFLENGCYTK